jgi:hypothetical protein
MTGFSWRLLQTIVGVLVVLPMSGEAQRRPDLSGQWELVEALASGRGRDGAASEGPRRTTSTTISGAPFNCGRGCTISHEGQTLTIDNAQLADYPGKDKSQPTPSVTLHLDGRHARVVDSFSPPRELPVTARWDGSKVRIDSAENGLPIARTQWLALEEGQLIVVSSTSANGEILGETTFRYRKK